jgi:hypothetical protein
MSHSLLRVSESVDRNRRSYCQEFAFHREELSPLLFQRISESKPVRTVTSGLPEFRAPQGS